MIDKNWIDLNLINERGLNNWVSRKSWWEEREYTPEWDSLHSLTSYLPKTAPIQERLYHVYHILDTTPLCKNCENEVKFINFGKGYREYCSNKCATQSPIRNEKISKNNDYVTIGNSLRKYHIDKYGKEYFFQTEDFKKKSKLTKFNKYSDPYYNNMEKNKITCTEKYGIDSLFKDQEFQRKIQKLKLNKYGKFIPGIPSKQSTSEIELRDWLNAMGYNFQPNYGILPHGLEIDCYDPNCQFAFEYCGLYWHSSRFKVPFYHRHKQNLAKEKGLELITIFEDEWLDRKQQVKDFIQSKLGIFKNRIYARDCEINLENRSDELKEFFDINHIQSYSNTFQKAITIRKNGELLGAASFSLHHRNSSIITLSRLSFKSGYQVIGGVSRMIKYARKNIGGFVTWSDNRWTDGSVYFKSGLVNDRNVGVDYSYVWGQKRIPKQSMQKKNIGCPDGITEKDFCLSWGLYRIYDCGKKRWVCY